MPNVARDDPNGFGERSYKPPALDVGLLTPGRDQDDATLQCLFSNAAALADIRFRHFLSDCRAIEGAMSEFDELQAREIDAAERFLRETLAELEAA